MTSSERGTRSQDYVWYGSISVILIFFRIINQKNFGCRYRAQIVDILIEILNLRIALGDSRLKSAETLESHPSAPFSYKFASILIKQEIGINITGGHIHAVVVSNTGTVT